MQPARSASGRHGLITSVPIRLCSVKDPTEVLTLPESGPQGSTLSYMLHLKTNGPWNSTTPKPSPRKSNREGDVPSTEVRASKFFISKFYHHVAVADCNQGIIRLHCTIKELHQSTPGQIGAKAELILG
jgi:hypothetical protein